MHRQALPKCILLAFAALSVAACDAEGLDPAADSDADGVPDIMDFCPESTGRVDHDGCGEGQMSDPAAAGMETFIIGAADDVPVVLRSHASTVSEAAQGFGVDGTLLMETPLGHMAISDAAVDLVGDAASGAHNQLVDMVGSANVSLPDMGVLEDIAIDDLVQAQVGFGYGRDLDHLDAPLVDERLYMYFDFDAGMSTSLGPIDFSIPQGAEATVVIDAADPSFYARGSVSGLGPLGDIPDVGFGVSATGLLPFEPAYTWGVEDEAEAFDAHIYLNGTIPLGRLPVSIDGEAVVDIDPDDDGETIIDDVDEQLRIGANADVIVNLDSGVGLTMDLKVGGATFAATLGGSESSGYFSAAAGTDELEFDLGIPLPIAPVAQVNVAGFVSEEFSDSFMRANGDFVVELPLIAGVNMHGDMSFDRDGFVMNATAGAFVNPLVELDGDAAVSIVARGTDDWMVEMVGNFDVIGMDLADDATLAFNQDGVFVNGEEVDLTPW